MCLNAHTRAPYLAGARPEYVARQLGDAKTGMLFKVYSKWLDGSDHRRERATPCTAFVHGLCTTRRAISLLIDITDHFWRTEGFGPTPPKGSNAST